MKRVQATTHQQVLKRLLKKRKFRRGYQEELDKLRQPKKSRALPIPA